MDLLSLFIAHFYMEVLASVHVVCFRLQELITCGVQRFAYLYTIAEDEVVRHTHMHARTRMHTHKHMHKIYLYFLLEVFVGQN